VSEIINTLEGFKMKIFINMLLLCLLSTFGYGNLVSAKEMAGVEFAESVSLVGANKELKLNGLAVRYKFFFKIYIGALYVEHVSQNADVLIKHSGAKRMLMHFVYDEVPVEKIVSGWIDGFEENNSEEDFKSLKTRIDQFNALFETMNEGDKVLLDYLPGQGTRVTVKGNEKGFIEGEDFNQALLKIWIGEEPVTEELKEGILGIDE
jgi:Chalcone isomerase-like